MDALQRNHESEAYYNKQFVAKRETQSASGVANKKGLFDVKGRRDTAEQQTDGLMVMEWQSSRDV